MNMGNITYFISLAECLSFTEAAKRCYITQTAMSRYILSLEDSLGVKLFIRDSHNVRLSEAGSVYYHEMKNLIRKYSAIEQQVKNISKNYNGGIRIGIGLYEYQYAEPIIINFLKLHPKIKLELYRSTYSDLITRLQSGDLDVLIAVEYCSKAFHQKEIVSMDLFSSRNILAMNSELAMKYRNESIKEILESENLITNSEDSGPYSNETIKLMLLNVVGYIPDKLVQTNSMKMQLKLVEIGYGIALLPSFLKDINNLNLISFDIPGSIKENYKLIHLVNNINPVTKLFIEFIN